MYQSACLHSRTMSYDATGVVRLIPPPIAEDGDGEGTALHRHALMVAQDHWSVAGMPAYCATSEEALEELVTFLREQNTGSLYVAPLHTPLYQRITHFVLCEWMYEVLTVRSGLHYYITQFRKNENRHSTPPV